MDYDNLVSAERVKALRERDSKLVAIIEAIDAIENSIEWRTLKENEFDLVLESIEKRLMLETSKPEVSLPEIYRLQGERKWAKNFADLSILRSKYYKELQSIRKVTPRD